MEITLSENQPIDTMKADYCALGLTMQSHVTSPTRSHIWHAGCKQHANTVNVMLMQNYMLYASLDEPQGI